MKNYVLATSLVFFATIGAMYQSIKPSEPQIFVEEETETPLPQNQTFTANGKTYKIDFSKFDISEDGIREVIYTNDTLEVYTLDGAITDVKELEEK